MADYRIKAHDTAMTEAMRFQQHIEARVVINLKDALASDHLLTDIKHMLRAGDQISICQYEGPVFDRLKAFVKLRVVDVREDGVEFMQESPAVSVKAAKSTSPAKKAA